MWRKVRNSVIAGLCGTTVHSILMLVHSRFGPLREFQAEPRYPTSAVVDNRRGGSPVSCMAAILHEWSLDLGIDIRPGIPFYARASPVAKGCVLWRVRLGYNELGIFSARRSWDIRYQLRIGNSANTSNARHDAQL
jgi:hypothetical protein